MALSVAIITPSFRQGRFIRATIESVLSQGYPGLEYFVADGGSKDETVKVLTAFGDRIRWVSEPDGGQTAAINKGLRNTTSDIVAYLNSDDVYLPGAIAKAVAFFEKYPDVDVVYGDFHAIDEGGELIDRIKTIPYDSAILLYDANYICQPASFYRRSLLDKIGMFDESLRFLMDYEFFLRAAKRGVGFKMIAEPLAAIRFHGDCKTLSDGVHPWRSERQKILAEYARPKVQSPSALKILRVIYRAKRYARLVMRGRVDFANIRLSRRLRQIV
jgi:glycosyltransferase involved in cell wall biosynthesis